MSKFETNPNYQNSNDQNNKSTTVSGNSHFLFENWDFEHLIFFRMSDFVRLISTEKSGFTVLSRAVVLINGGIIVNPLEIGKIKKSKCFF